jgi:hypothetical protein
MEAPSPLKLLRSGQIDQKSYERIAGKRAARPPVRPFRDLILASNGAKVPRRESIRACTMPSLKRGWSVM